MRISALRVAHRLHIGPSVNTPENTNMKNNTKSAAIKSIDLNHVVGGHHHHGWRGGYAVAGAYAYAAAPAAPVAYAAAPVAYAAPSVSVRLRYR